MCVLSSCFWRARALHIYLHGLFYYFTSGCMYISTQQLVRMFDGGDWDKSHSSGRQLLYKTWMWKPPDGILSACNLSARLTSLQTRNCKIESRPRWIVQPTYGARPGRASSTWRLSGSRIVMGRGQWEGVKAERVQSRSLTVRLQRTKVYVKFMSTGNRLAIKVYEMTLPDM